MNAGAWRSSCINLSLPSARTQPSPTARPPSASEHLVAPGQFATIALHLGRVAPEDALRGQQRPGQRFRVHVLDSHGRI